MVYVLRRNGINDNIIDLCRLKQKGMHVNYLANSITGIASEVHRCKL